MGVFCKVEREDHNGVIDYGLRLSGEINIKPDWCNKDQTISHCRHWKSIFLNIVGCEDKRVGGCLSIKKNFKVEHKCKPPSWCSCTYASVACYGQDHGNCDFAECKFLKISDLPSFGIKEINKLKTI